MTSASGSVTRVFAVAPLANGDLGLESGGSDTPPTSALSPPGAPSHRPLSDGPFTVQEVTGWLLPSRLVNTDGTPGTDDGAGVLPPTYWYPPSTLSPGGSGGGSTEGRCRLVAPAATAR